MAYFPNGSDPNGEHFKNECSECPIKEDDFFAPCPVYSAQGNHNYDQCNNKEFEACLKTLVNDKGECQMKPLIDDLIQKDLHKNETKLFD